MERWVPPLFAFAIGPFLAERPLCAPAVAYATVGQGAGSRLITRVAASPLSTLSIA